MSSDFWQILVEKNMNLIKIGIYKGLKKVVSMIDSKVKAFNAKLASDSPYTYLDTPFVDNLLLNTTMTKAPEISQEKNQINIHMDGLYVYDPTSHINVPDPNHTWPKIIDAGKQRN